MNTDPTLMPSTGAFAGVRVPEPAVDLALLVQHLAESLRPRAIADPKYPESVLPFVTWDPAERALILDTGAVLVRLWTSPAARAALRGFLIDADVPRTHARAHLGGVIRPRSEAALRDATGRLAAAIDEQIDEAVGAGFDPALLSNSPSAAVLDTIGERVGCDPQKTLQGQTRLSRTRIDAVPRTQEGRRDEVARIMDAIEEVDGVRSTHTENFFASVERRLLAEGHSPRRVGAAIQYHKQSAERSATQVARFFDFLEDDALSRVRARVGSHIMQALGAEAEQRHQASTKGDWALLAAYAGRAAGLLDALSAPRTPAVRLNLSAAFGQNASFSLRDQVINAGFSTCLPVWPQWRTQMFEEQSATATPSGGPTTVRELSYHFRVNGTVPGTGRPSYDSRLERIERDWLKVASESAEPDSREQRVNRSLAELAFLWAAVPEGPDTPADSADALRAVREVAGRLEEGGRQAIGEVLGELRGRSDAVRRVARSLTALLREKGTVLTGSVSGRRWDYYVNVLPGILDMQRICGELDDPLAREAQGAREQVAFLRHVWVTRDKGLPDAVLSVRVQVHLAERSLSTVGDPKVLDVRRRLPENLMQVVWRSAAMKGRCDPREESWVVSPRIEVVYDTRTVGWPDDRSTNAGALNVLAATRSALAVLAHTALLRLAQRAEAATGLRPSLSVVRLQEQGRGAGALSGDEGVYAAAQAVEIALARDADIRMQGMVVDAAAADDPYKRRGTYAALLAAFPIQMAQPRGERPMVGLVTYAARPCNEHPDLPGADGRALVMSRTYLAAPINSPFDGYELRPADCRTELTDPLEALPESVAGEIEGLYAGGCRHVILISHRYGQRRAGGAAAHSRLRDQTEALVRISLGHPDLNVYPLVRDVFDATRLRQRDRDTEDAFEILRSSDHVTGVAGPMPEEWARPRRRYEPVYSLATLHVVGGPAAEVEKPQSGFCTYFLLRDDGMAPTETRVRLEGDLLGDASPVRSSLLAVLRGVHYLEAERSAGGYVQPVLDPYGWMTPDSAGAVGEVLALPPSRRRGGSVGLSLTALLDHTSRAAHALRLDRSTAPEGGR